MKSRLARLVPLCFLAAPAAAQELALRDDLCLSWTDLEPQAIACSASHDGLELRQFFSGSNRYWLTPNRGRSCLRSGDPMELARCHTNDTVSWGQREAADEATELFPWADPDSCLAWIDGRLGLGDCGSPNSAWYDAP